VNMFRAMVDNGGDIDAGILAYSELVEAEKEKLSRDAYEKLLVACNDDGAIILKLIKSLLEPLSTDIVEAYAGEEAGVGLHDIRNTIAVDCTLCGQGIVRNRRGRELLKYHQRRGRALEEAQRMSVSYYARNIV
jgi:hypothetical protein